MAEITGTAGAAVTGQVTEALCKELRRSAPQSNPRAKPGGQRSTDNNSALIRRALLQYCYQAAFFLAGAFFLAAAFFLGAAFFLAAGFFLAAAFFFLGLAAALSTILAA